MRPNATPTVAASRCPTARGPPKKWRVGCSPPPTGRALIPCWSRCTGDRIATSWSIPASMSIGDPLLEAGWAILALNTVGSSSYSEEFGSRLIGRWGELDLPQYLSAINQLKQEGTVSDEVSVSHLGPHLDIAGLGRSTMPCGPGRGVARSTGSVGKGAQSPDRLSGRQPPRVIHGQAESAQGLLRTAHRVNGLNGPIVLIKF